MTQPSLMPSELKEEIQKVVLPVVAVSRDGRWHNCGTGFVVAAMGRHALLISAAHVFDTVHRIDQPLPRHHVSSMFRVESHEIQLKHTQMRAVYRDPQRCLQLVVIEKVSMMNPMDIAVCTIRLTDEAPTSANFQKSISIDTTPPAKDEKYVAVGYAGMDVEQEVKNGIGAGTGTFRFSVEWRPGDVVEVFPSRGPRNEPTSCFQLNVAFDSGMSGGPLLKVSHFPELVAGGIVGRDSSFTEAGQLGSGDLALAWPLWLSMAIPVEIEAPPNGIERVLFVELVRRGIVDDRGDALSHIRIDAQRCNGGTVVTWSS